METVPSGGVDCPDVATISSMSIRAVVLILDRGCSTSVFMVVVGFFFFKGTFLCSVSSKNNKKLHLGAILVGISNTRKTKSQTRAVRLTKGTISGAVAPYLSASFSRCIEKYSNFPICFIHHNRTSYESTTDGASVQQTRRGLTLTRNGPNRMDESVVGVQEKKLILRITSTATAERPSQRMDKVRTQRLRVDRSHKTK